MNDVALRRLSMIAEKVLPWTGALYGAAAGLLVGRRVHAVRSSSLPQGVLGGFRRDIQKVGADR